MADPSKIARLADLHEFAELKAHFEERREQDTVALGKKMIANPEAYDRIDAERLKAFYAGALAVLDAPLKARRDVLQEGKA